MSTHPFSATSSPPSSTISDPPLPFAVHLFSNYAGDRQASMLRYANSLQNALSQNAASICRVSSFSPRFSGGRANVWASRWKRYFEFSYLAGRYSGRINHILDHGNSHLINFLPRDRTIITCHDLNTLKLANVPGAPSKRYVYSFRAKVLQLKKAACLITDSECNKKDITDFLGIAPEKIHVVYLGVDHDRFRPIEQNESKEALRAKFKITWPFTIFHVGAPTFYKNIDGIIECLSILRQNHHLDVHFVRVGPPLTNNLKQQVEKRRLQDYVHTLSPNDDIELRQLYMASDVLLFPSWGEGFGLPPLEAFCCGTPVVVSTFPAILEGTGSAALTVPPENPSAMAAAVARILGDASLRERMRSEGYAQASKFNWRETAIGTAEVYRQLWRESQ